MIWWCGSIRGKTHAEPVMGGIVIFLPVALTENSSARNVGEHSACCIGPIRWQQRKKPSISSNQRRLELARIALWGRSNSEHSKSGKYSRVRRIMKVTLNSISTSDSAHWSLPGKQLIRIMFQMIYALYGTPITRIKWIRKQDPFFQNLFMNSETRKQPARAHKWTKLWLLK